MNTTLSPNIKSMSPLLLVADLDQSIMFYTQYLGFALDFRFEDFYAGIARDSFTIHLKLGWPDEKERKKRKKGEDLDLSFSVSDIQQFYDAIKTTPVSIVQPLREMPYGREFYITDPDGYLIGFVE
ncbi:MAG TPA: VOC family protein [Mucilaginibacter sp.]|jgi:catechol 2,3-dioxygenase-like lactoylglutathione lyase family enzyme